MTRLAPPLLASTLLAAAGALPGCALIAGLEDHELAPPPAGSLCIPEGGWCLGSTLKVCGADGASASQTVCAGQTPVCDLEGRQCDACVAGTATCNGATLEVCAADGQSVTTESCETAALCDAGMAMCLGEGTALQIAAGGGHACALLEGGEVRCWGANGDRQLGDGTREHRPSAVAVSGLAKATRIAAGFEHTCAVLENGSVSCWGRNYEGQLGRAPSEPGDPAVVAGLDDIAELALGFRVSCARSSTGDVRCWGAGADGSLGTGMGAADSSSPLLVVSGAAHIAAASNVASVCALLADETVMCWGAGIGAPTQILPAGSGALEVAVAGAGTDNYASEKIFVRLAAGLRWTRPDPGGYPPFEDFAAGAVAQMSGATSLCAMRDDGSAACTGMDWNGGPPSELSAIPTLEAGSTAEIRAGVNFTCVRSPERNVRCWGQNHEGQLGNGKASQLLVPTLVPSVANVADLWSGHDAVAATLADGWVLGWGTSYALGVGSEDRAKLSVSFGSDNRAVRLGDGDDLAYLHKQGGSLILANGGELETDTRLNATGFADFTDARPAQAADVALRTGGSVVFFVAEDVADHGGIFGSGSETASAEDVITVPGLPASIGLAARDGGGHMCAWTAAGALWCWGDGHRGQVGSGASGEDETAHVLSPFATFAATSGPKIVSACVGGQHTCAVASDGRVYCFGDNGYGQLGLGDTPATAQPVEVPGVTGAASVTCGAGHTCVLRTDATALCWGENGSGQLGDGTRERRDVPVVVEGLSGAVSLHAGSYFTCARLASRRVSCWGEGSAGQVGNGGAMSYDSPQAVMGLGP